MTITIDSDTFTTEEALELPVSISADLKFALFDKEIGTDPYEIEDLGLVKVSLPYEEVVDIDSMWFEDNNIGSALLNATKFNTGSIEYVGFHDSEPNLDDCLGGYDTSGIIYIVLQYPENGNVGRALYGNVYFQGDGILFTNDYDE